MSSEPRTRLGERIRAMLAGTPLSVYEIVQRLEGEDYRAILQAWGDVRAAIALAPDSAGRYHMPTTPPEK